MFLKKLLILSRSCYWNFCDPERLHPAPAGVPGIRPVSFSHDGVFSARRDWIILRHLQRREGMAKSNNRKKEVAQPTVFHQARDEMFQQIMRCGVIQATPDDQAVWFTDTVAYLSERYHELSAEQIDELRTLGLRFCQPPKKMEPATADTASYG